MKSPALVALALASLATASANASITWYIQINNTNLASEVFSVVTNGELLDGQAAAGEYRIESVTGISSAYIPLTTTELGYAASNGRGFVWDGSGATEFWRYVQTSPFDQTRYEGFQFYTEHGTYQSPYGQSSNGWWHTASANSGLGDASGAVNITGGASIVSLTNPIPAPGAVALLGVAGLFGRRRR